jgi:ATP-dependent RNA/DNA helicase, senataxin
LLKQNALILANRSSRELINLGDAHWFCPRTSPDDDTYFFDEDRLPDAPEDSKSKETREGAIQNFEARKPTIFRALQIFAYDGGDSAQHLNQVKSKIKHFMQSCDVCVRKYHELRSELKQELESEHDVELVAMFMKRFDIFNNDRISNNLDHATNQLLRLAEGDRTLRNLDEAAIFAFFEAISSSQFCGNETLVQEHFDKPFGLIKGVKKLITKTYLPGVAAFLFSINDARRQWAEKIWSRISRSPSRKEFEWMAHHFVLSSLYRVQMGNLDTALLPIFWRGMRTIISRLDRDLITHSLRELEVDIFRLTLDHMHVEFDAFRDLIIFVSQVLETAPDAFWDSMGAINPPTVIEQVFQSPNLATILSDGEESSLSDVFSWQKPFLQSLSAANTPFACRSLVQHFMEIHKDESLPRITRSYAFEHALYGLSVSLNILSRAMGNVDPACSGEMLQLVDKYSSEILSRTKALKNNATADASLALKIVQDAIDLETSLVLTAYTTISNGKTLIGHHLSFVGTGIWRKVPKILRPNDVALATCSLIGSRKLALVEKIVAKNRPLSTQASELNQAIDKCSGYVTEILESVNDFALDDIASFFKSPSQAAGIIMTLFFADESARIAALEIFKTLNSEGEPSRRDALRAILKDSYTSTITALAEAISKVRIGKVYQPLKAVITIAGDVIDSLCNSQDGLLRSKDLTSEECDATIWLWRALWQALTTIFNNTEKWSAYHDRLELMDFCRDVMQFADDLFEYHRVIVNSLVEEDADSKQKDSITQLLLKSPNEVMTSMVKWLRLRDEFLAGKITRLVSELLIKLHDASLEISNETKMYLESLLGGSIRVKLSDGQIASIAQALDAHLGISSVSTGLATKPAKVAKQAQITSFIKDGTISAIKRESDTLSGSESGSDGMAKVLRDSTKGAQKYAAMVAARPPAPLTKKPLPVNEAFLRQRQADKEARLKADREKAKELRGLAEAGSGLNSIRLIAKDHNVKGDLMATSSSSSESDDSDDDLDRELFGSPLKKSKGPTRPSRSDIKMLKEVPKMPVKLKRQVRSARDMRARIAPDLSALHRVLLSWDYFHTGEYPPGSNAEQFQKLPAKFPSPEHYKSLFLPLLLLEAWQSFVKAREENSFKNLEIKVANRSNVDSFIEISTLMPVDENFNRDVGEGDVVLLSTSKTPSQSPDHEHCLARVHKISRKRQGLEILYRAIAGASLTKYLNTDAKIWGVKIQSLTPLEREYGALQGLQYYDLCDYILKAQPSNLLNYKDHQIDPIAQNYQLNKAQGKAVKSAIDNDAFTLIQGPPGSGKTKTIIAIVGALLSDSFRNGPSGSAINVPGGVKAAVPQPQASKKLLVCAPSNAAVDELVIRFKEGVRTLSGQDRSINVIRLGRSDAINVAVQDVTLEQLVNAKLTARSGGDNNRQETQRLMKEHQEVSEKFRQARALLDSENTKQAKDEFDALKRQKAILGTRIDKSKDQDTHSNREAEMERKRVQQHILDGAHVICATLSGSGHEMFQNLNIEFETVVVDEAAQCVEASALIPLKYGCAKCILVGDPKQLPPTVLSKEATRFQYEQSLFVRMQTNYPDHVHLLDTQYRMHPEISQFPSATFYSGRLLDGPDMAKLRVQPWHSAALLGPYRFFDVQGQHQAAPKGHSLINLAEIEVALRLYHRLTTDFAGFNFRSKIGIITPYKSQLAELKFRFKREYGPAIFENVEFNTTDAFQGRESEVIIFSCVRASPAGNIGFLQDIRRMNVGLTRAKSSLWVLGNSDSLMRGEFWGKLIENAKSRGRFTSGRYMEDLRRPIPVDQREKWTSPVEAPTNTAVKRTQQTPQAKPLGLGTHKPIETARKLSIAAIEESRSERSSAPSSRMSSVSLDTTPMEIDETSPDTSTNNSNKPKPLTIADSTPIITNRPKNPIFPSGVRPPVTTVRKRQAANPLLPPKRDKKPKN